MSEIRNLIIGLVLLSMAVSNAFYLVENDDRKQLNNNSKIDVESLQVIETLRISYDHKRSKENDGFPKNYQVSLIVIDESSLEADKYLQFSFVKLDPIKDYSYPVESLNIYTLDEESGELVRFDDNDDEDSKDEVAEKEFELYSLDNVNSDGFLQGYATLIKNKRRRRQSSAESKEEEEEVFYPFRMIGTIYYTDANSGLNYVYEILPIKSKKDRKKRQTDNKATDTDDLHIDDDARKNSHKIIKRQIKSNTYDSINYLNTNAIEDFIQDFKMANIIKRRKREENKPPIDLVSEILVVTDHSVYLDHQAFYNTQDKSVVLSNMKIYFTHLLNGVNLRYKNTFDNDDDIRLTIKVKNFLFLTSANASKWTDSKHVGDSKIKEYKNRGVVVDDITVNAFSSFMNTLKFDFEYDQALGLFNKELITATQSDPIERRSSVVGYAFISGVCDQYRKFLISEEIGGFISIETIAHELGHSFGAMHDGLPGQLTYSCNSSDNFIMTPATGTFHDNLKNQLKFSPCSISQFKALILSSNSNNETVLSSQAQCLEQKATSSDNILLSSSNEHEKNLFDKLPGQIWTADDQCKMIHGENSSFPHSTKSTLCNALSCRRSTDPTFYDYTDGIGAADGTLCDYGKVCKQMECIDTPLAVAQLSSPLKQTTTDCPFGDDMVINGQVFYEHKLPRAQMTCEEVINHLYSIDIFAPAYCFQNPFFKRTCCQTCKKYKSLWCYDRTPSCGQYAEYCEYVGATLNSIPIKEVCPKTCNICPNVTKLECDSSMVCQNGGTCVNDTMFENDYLTLAYKCVCAIGFYGDLCEQKDPCLPNPCSKGQAECIRVGSMGYNCKIKGENTTHEHETITVDIELLSPKLTPTVKLTNSKASTKEATTTTTTTTKKLKSIITATTSSKKPIKKLQQKPSTAKPTTIETTTTTTTTTTKKPTTTKTTKKYRTITATTKKTTTTSTTPEPVVTIEVNMDPFEPQEQQAAPTNSISPEDQGPCRDKSAVCPFFRRFCDSNSYLEGRPIKMKCPITCESCELYEMSLSMSPLLNNKEPPTPSPPPTTQPPPPPPQNNMKKFCTDKDPNICDKFVNYCNVEAMVFGVRVNEFCPMTCNMCTSPPNWSLKRSLELTNINNNNNDYQKTFECKDSLPYCSALKKYCRIYRGTVNNMPITDQCAKTCELC